MTGRWIDAEIVDNEFLGSTDFCGCNRWYSRDHVAGTDNHATIELHGFSKQIDVVKKDSVPDDPSSGNTVTVIPSPDAPLQLRCERR